MTDKLREAASWRKQKTPLVREYAKDHGKLLSEIAGRGFLNLPGYAYDMENELELRLKLGLSEINYKILSETIERELKQAGIDFNVEYAEAAMAWELEKQGLLSAWDHELAGIKQGMATEEEVLARLALEVDARQAVLIAAKSAIDLEMEGYRKALADLDAATAPYEVQLANAKLLTAQKKLELLPIIEEIIVKEGELIVLEAGKTDYYRQLIDAEREVAEKKQTLVPGLTKLATAIQRHAALMPTQIETEKDIAEEKTAQAQAKVKIAQNNVDQITKEIETATKDIEINEAKRDLADKKFDNEQELIAIETDKEIAYQDRLNESFNAVQDDERNTQSKIIANKQTIHSTVNETRKDSAQRITGAQKCSPHTWG